MIQYMYVGSWELQTGKAPYGIYAFRYENGNTKLIAEYRPDIKVGCILIDGNRFYATDEAMGYTGAPEGGGRIVTFAIGSDGLLTETSVSPSFGVYPCYVALTINRRYLVLANHSTLRGKILKTAFVDGEYKVINERHESNLVLFRLKKDGSIDKAVDVFDLLSVSGEARPNSMPHFIRRLPDKDIFLVVENGEDRIYRFEVDEKDEKLKLIQGAYEAEKGTNPRYFASSPDFSSIYVVDEKRPYINTLSVDIQSGAMKRLQSVEMVPEDQPILQSPAPAPAPVSPTDVVIDRNGKYVYAACRGTDTISVFTVKEEGLLELVQIVESGGHNPRSLSFDPDEKYLYCCNLDSNVICAFSKASDGKLKKSHEIHVNDPGFIRFYTE